MNNKYIQHFIANWKTSVQPILSIIMFTAPFATLDGSPIHNKTVLWAIGVLAAAAKVGIGFVQVDAGTVAANTPQGIKVVDSHETPNDPNVTAVTK